MTTQVFREMQIYELVRQAADCWNISLEQVAKFQEWWDCGKTENVAQKIVQTYKTELGILGEEKRFAHRFSQFYKQHTSYTFLEEKTSPNVINLLDIAQYYLTNPEITVPNFVIHIASQNLCDIAELGESVLVLTGEKMVELLEEKQMKKKKQRGFILDYLKKVQMLVEGMQIVSTKSLPDLYISNSISIKFSVDLPVKCRNLILAKKVRIKGIRFMPTQMQVMGGI